MNDTTAAILVITAFACGFFWLGYLWRGIVMFYRAKRLTSPPRKG